MLVSQAQTDSINLSDRFYQSVRCSAALLLVLSVSAAVSVSASLPVSVIRVPEEEEFTHRTKSNSLSRGTTSHVRVRERAHWCVLSRA